MDAEWTGYAIHLENQDGLRNGSVSMDFTFRDFQVPDEIDPRPFVRHDKQGNMGSCGGFGNTNCGEYLWALSHGNWSDDRQFSPLFSYLEAQRLDGLLGRDRGSTISSGLEISKTIGYLESKHLPYSTPYPSNATTLITQDMRSKATAFKIRSHTWMESYQDIFKYIASNSGVIYPGTPWNNSFYASNGVLESVSFSNRDGGHAYCIAGFSKRKDSKNRNYLWRLNSHNDSWTEIAPSVIDSLCRHQYTSIVGVSDLMTPGPRKMNWKKDRVLE